MVIKNKNILILAFAFILFLTIVIVKYINNVRYRSQALRDIATSHIQANVPNNDDFGKLLTRDLETYFKGIYNKDVSVKYEFLREGATQTGIAFPKYYLWVSVYDVNQTLVEGAVRIAAIDKQRFNVTNFLSRSEIKSDVDKIYDIFPKPVCERIKGKL